MNFVDVWPKFKEVIIHISLDDVEERGEYWRNGLDWDRFVKNVREVKRICELHPNVKMAYSTTIFTYNIHRLDSIVEYLQKHDLLDNNVKLLVNSSVCFTEHHDVSTLTEEFKQYAQPHVDRAVELLKDHPNKSDMEAVVNKLKLLKCDYHEASKRHESVAHESLRIFAAKHYAKLDRIRNQSLKQVAPELYDFYKDYGYDEEYKLFVDHPTEIYSVVENLKKRGYCLGTDFDFMYNPSKYSDNGFELIYHKHVVFRFFKDELATWFELVYK
jgi:hypothetical protein